MNHYNIIRDHSSIGKSPAEQAGIKLDLGENKIESLIKLASKNQQTPYIEHCSMTKDRGEGELFSKQTDASKVKDIARKFFQYNYSACSIESATLQNNTDRKSTRLNSSHLVISYAVFCLKKKKDID